MQCPSCKAMVPEGSRFCGQCGTSLPLSCSACGHANPAQSKFCAQCGASLNDGRSPGKVSFTPRPTSTYRASAPTILQLFDQPPDATARLGSMSAR